MIRLRGQLEQGYTEVPRAPFSWVSRKGLPEAVTYLQ